MSDLKKKALDYHRLPRPGKLSVESSKPCATQQDLSLAYTPGVAQPVLEIAKNPKTAYDYTNKGNLVAVITDGTAILGLGNLGPLAAKPVMEGKAVLFKQFAGIDVFDIEVQAKSVKEFIRVVEAIAPTFGGINLEDIAAPHCFEIEAALRKSLDIPVFHDDQHGTAVIICAGLINALHVQGKTLSEAKITCLGAGAAGIASMNLLIAMGATKANVTFVDSKGVIHKGRDEISDLFAEKHQRPRKTDIAELTREAREMLRTHFLTADMGISGANFIVAETGTTLIVTNEGNGRMTTTLPRVHVAITGIEKVVPTLEDVATLLRLLPRSATGQTISNYVSFTTGIKDGAQSAGAKSTDAQDSFGAEHFHIILLDAGRTKLIGTDMQEMLRCIRCGACMNHCPVYQNVGGHAYGWVYPGPMGSILTPTYVGLENALDLPHASTLCNQCGVVCPVKIPLPDLMRKLREKQTERGLRPWHERFALRVWSWAAQRPRVYALLSNIGVTTLGWMGGSAKLIHYLPFGGGWTAGRDLPAPQGRTFREIYGERK